MHTNSWIIILKKDSIIFRNSLVSSTDLVIFFLIIYFLTCDIIHKPEHPIDKIMIYIIIGIYITSCVIISHLGSEEIQIQILYK